MTHSILEETESFKAFLYRKILSPVSVDHYIIYLVKMLELMNETGIELNQIIVNSFLDAYPHGLGRAFLKNYLEFMGRKDLDIPKRTGHVPRKEVATIPPNESELIREKLYNHDERFGLIFDISLGCALRRQEVMSIKAGDIKIEGEDKMFILIKRGKGNKERIVFVPKDIAVLIITFCYNHKLTPADYLFTSKKNIGKILDVTAWNKAFLFACIEAVGKRYHPHQLRHTKSTEWFEKGIDIVRIQQRLGHSSIATTRLYLNPDSKKELERWSNEE